MNHAPTLLPMVLPPSDPQGRSVLHWAAARNDVPGVNAALQRGLPVNGATVQGWTPLHFAINTRALGAVETLLRHGADVNLPNVRGRTPLMLMASTWAGDERDRRMLDALLAAGADINLVPETSDDDEPSSLLHEMAVNDQADMLKEVMARRSLQLQGAPMGCFSLEEEMIFHPNTAPAFTEVFLRTPGFLERLIGRYDTRGNGLLHHLVRLGAEPNPSWLALAALTPLNLPNHSGATALHLATWLNKPAWQAALLELGADPTVRDEAGQMAWPEAVEVGLDLDEAAPGGDPEMDPIVQLAMLQAALADRSLAGEDLNFVREEIVRLQQALREGTTPPPTPGKTVIGEAATPRARLSVYLKDNRSALLSAARRLLTETPPAELLHGQMVARDSEPTVGQGAVTAVPGADPQATVVRTLRDRRFPVFNQAPRWTEQDVKQKRFDHLDKGLPCWVPEMDAWAWQESMDQDFPWMKEVTARLVRWLVVKQHKGLVVTWPNLVLWGPSGSGKTLYWRKAFERLGQPRMMLSMGGTNDSAMIRGTAKGWANAEPGLALNALAGKGVVNPVIVLDDLDKLVGSDNNGNAHEALQPLIERASARNYQDNFLNLEIDVSRISWVGTVTEEERLPKALRDRFEFVTVEGPDYTNPQHFEAVLATAQRLAREQWGFDQPEDGPSLSPEAIRSLRKTRWTSLRSFSKQVEALMGEMLYQDAIEHAMTSPGHARHAALWRPQHTLNARRPDNLGPSPAAPSSNTDPAPGPRTSQHPD